MKYPHVRVQPNIDDLMCAGMSSGPAKVQNFIHLQIQSNEKIVLPKTGS